MNYQIDDNFIGVFDNFMNEGVCESYINQFKDLEKHNFVYTRNHMFQSKRHLQDDTAADLSEMSFYEEKKTFNLQGTGKVFSDTFFEKIYPLYAQKFSMLNDCCSHHIFSLKLQKSLPGQGYHIWHCENDGTRNNNRLLAVMLYLNDVEEGGETEFLYQKVRIKPKKNRVVVWPAYFTHTHRGNQPLSGEKYILTGWVEFTG